MYQAVIVDDEPVIVSGIRDALDWEGFGFEIALATTSPATVLSFLSVHPVHLLITDISMPEMDGIALIREAKSLVPLLSVIVLSAYDNFDYVKGALRYGAENYLLKPLSSDELSDSIRNVVSHVKEREVLNMNYGGTMLTFRSTFVEQWLKNLLTPETLLERAGLLGINLEMDNYTAVIFSADNRDAASMSRFFDFLLSLLPGRFLAHFTSKCLTVWSAFFPGWILPRKYVPLSCICWLCPKAWGFPSPPAWGRRFLFTSPSAKATARPAPLFLQLLPDFLCLTG